MTVYQIIHHYDTDGGFGDAIPCEEVIATFSTYDVAIKFVERYNNPHIYDCPYAELECGLLEIVACDVLDNFDESDEEFKMIERKLNFIQSWCKPAKSIKENENDN